MELSNCFHNFFTISRSSLAFKLGSVKNNLIIALINQPGTYKKTNQILAMCPKVLVMVRAIIHIEGSSFSGL